MTETPFKLATVHAGRTPFVVMVIDDRGWSLNGVYKAWRQGKRGGALVGVTSIRLMLDDWAPNFEALCDMANFVAAGHALPELTVDMDAIRYLPPILGPGKMMYAAANYGGHIREMVEAGTAKTDEERANMLDRDKARVRPYSFLKAASCLSGAYDDIVIPPDTSKVDWEVELALAIGCTGKRIAAEHAMDHVAGFMTTNDISARDWNMREDWPTLRTDWFGGKSHDTFAPMGPYFVPSAFVPDYRDLRLTLKVSGETKQDGVAGEMVFSVEEQVEHCSTLVTLDPGDIISTGTPEGVGHAAGTYLKAGDVVETEVEGLGAQRNNVVAENVIP
ncbi:MAG: 5-carboxymethyl-2-hydroxymuconate delta-isomerase [Alphaproteobacteria bacterium]|nr:5-carboxymethyl-2-hydroxymuconate delta-isomerase [Alphaproteobacteria bacterium]HCP00952.1 5-carboxymethyl-2-hydroxymuconate delta-isomerase [Rhodospirillaceae bacterium]